MSARPALVVLLLAVALPARAIDVPVAGRRIVLRASAKRPGGRALHLVIRDGAIAAPFPDPTAGAGLIVSGGAADGQCHAEIALDPLRWAPVGGAGAQRGWRYRVGAPGTQGVRRIVVKPGRILVNAGGAGWPCRLTASTERVPLAAELRVGGTRYCSAFGGTITKNRAGRFRANDATAPSACPKTDLTVADLNILHGLVCPGAPDNCRKTDRIDLLFQWIVASGCPDVVTFQEVFSPAVPLLESHLTTACPFAYEEVYLSNLGIDDQMILSRYPVVSSELVLLYKNGRSVTHARVDHPIGPVDVFTTHLASSSDGAQSPCTDDCPAECVTAGAATRRDCQGVQVANLIADRHQVATPAVAAGDFNESPGTFVYDQFASRGWIDTYLAAGNPECDPMTGVGCTSGRDDVSLSQLESPVSNEIERIDYVWLVPPGSGSLCTPSLDRATDDDGDGTATRIFDDGPNPFAATCGPLPDPICWPSDHEGAELDLNCS